MSKQDNNSLYEQQEEKIRAQSDAFIGILTKRGILGDQDVDDEKIRAAQQEKKKAAYHNTLVLLQQYRNIAWMLECFPSTVAEELDQPFEDLDELIDRVDVEMAMGNRKLENRIGSIQKSRLMLDRVNEALTVLRNFTSHRNCFSSLERESICSFTCNDAASSVFTATVRCFR